MTPREVVDLIADLRGGTPKVCDFCHQPMRGSEAMPEEGGLWACRTCWDRFEGQDRQDEGVFRGDIQ